MGERKMRLNIKTKEGKIKLASSHIDFGTKIVSVALYAALAGLFVVISNWGDPVYSQSWWVAYIVYIAFCGITGVWMRKVGFELYDEAHR